MSVELQFNLQEWMKKTFISVPFPVNINFNLLLVMYEHTVCICMYVGSPKHRHASKSVVLIVAHQ